jgi:hypothetical protein
MKARKRCPNCGGSFAGGGSFKRHLDNCTDLSGKQNASTGSNPTKGPEEPGSPAQNLLPVPVLADQSEVNRRPVEVGEEARESTREEPIQDSRGGQTLFARVTKIPFNPRMVGARLADGTEVEVWVGRNSSLWLDCPLEVKVSLDYPGYYEIVGELPRGRWDRGYAERFHAGGD